MHLGGMEGFKQCIRQLRSLLRRQGRNRDDADDLIQEAFLRLHVYCQNEEVQKRSAFLSRTVLNLSIDLHRKEHRELYADESIDNLVLVDLRPSPEQELAAAQRLAKVSTVLDELGPRTREIFYMHRVEGYSCAYIAAHFEISVSAVEKHIARAVLSIMDAMERL
jgi:RNA polymerase sigma-70 factor (ECF subfamily)